MTRTQLNTFNQQRFAPFRERMKPFPTELDFEIEYVAPPEQEERERYLEERRIKRDNVQVRMPKTIFSKL